MGGSAGDQPPAQSVRTPGRPLDETDPAAARRLGIGGLTEGTDAGARRETSLRQMSNGSGWGGLAPGPGEPGGRPSTTSPSTAASVNAAEFRNLSADAAERTIDARYAANLGAMSADAAQRTVDARRAQAEAAAATAAHGATGATAAPEPAAASASHSVAAGDTLSALARKYGTSVTELATRNNITNPDRITVGQVIDLPGGSAPSTPNPAPTSTHSVAAGDTLSALARRYGTSVSELATRNDITNPDRITVGQVIDLPGGSSTPAPGPTPTSAPEPEPEPDITAPAGTRFQAPVAGGVFTSGFRTPQRPDHEGVDIAVPIGTPVEAAADGVVSLVKNDPRGYGNYMIVSHDDGLSTLYGHLDSYHVQQGERVTADTVIASSGNTGGSTGPHLHFEVIEGTTVSDPTLNPADYIPIP